MSKPLYALEDAIVLGRRELCRRKGHEVQAVYSRTANGQTVIHGYLCRNCDVNVAFSYPLLPSGLDPNSVTPPV